MEKERLHEMIRENERVMRERAEKNSWRLQERARKDRERTYADRNKGVGHGLGHPPISGPI